MKIGDKIEIKIKHPTKLKSNKSHYPEKIYKGTFIPSQNPKIFSIKLKSGYNIGIEKNKIISKKIIQSAKEKIKPSFKIKEDKSLPTIYILHTGGTVASEVSYETGAVTPQFTPEELVQKYPEIQKMANIKAKLISNKWSEDLNFKDYNKIAKEIKKHINEADGFIITHGTDTMHYTSAALSFILEDLPKPVILVGSQRSSDRPSADSFLNLYCAVKFIAETDFADVSICMHDKIEDKACAILKGTRARKMHTSRRDAFKAINSGKIAKVYFNKIEFKEDYQKRNNNHLIIKPIKENIKIAIIKIYPGITEKEINLYKNYDGMIIEALGLGQIPTENKKLMATLKTLSKKMPIALTSQCIYGRINHNVYEAGRKIKELGIMGNLLDTTTETAYIKLAWLLSNYKKQEIKRLYNKNLRGEITKRIII